MNGEISWHSRGYLPHFELGQKAQNVCFHLADSLPQAYLRRLQESLSTLEYRKKYDAWVDRGYGSCVLREPVVAAEVQRSLLAFDAVRYRMLAWVVMPNHVHCMFVPLEDWTVASIVGSWKKYTARRIRDYVRGLGRPADIGSVWHREYWDRYIRDKDHYYKAIDYIHFNPVKARLVARPSEWRWSSAWRGEEES